MSTIWVEQNQDGQIYYWNTKTGKTQWDKPEELKTESEKRDQSTQYYWVRHAERAWVPAKPLDGRAVSGQWIQYETDEYMDVKKRDIGPKITDVTTTKLNVTDLVQLHKVEEPFIIHLLQRRFLNDQIWTSVGDILIAINPFKSMNHFTPSESEQYRSRGLKELPPHPYLIIDEAFNDMINKQTDQSILISGESGAGKTFTVRVCMGYVSEIAGSPLGVEKKVMATNRVLESFGNAKTLRNDNSSRFGKFIQLYFDMNHKIIGCAIENYLLEKSRICFQQENERNYHIFYYLTTQLTSVEKQALLLEDATEYHYTNQSGTYIGDSHEDDVEFSGARQDFAELGFDDERINHIFQVTAGILNMGNAEFVSDGNTGSNVKTDSMRFVGNAAKLLGVDREGLCKVLTGNVNILRSGEEIPVAFTPQQANNARDALAKGIYGRLFDWLINAVNEAMFVTPEIAKACRKIGMVDIFGFEIFKTNYFEQLSINFANEKLQQMFNKHTFLLEEQTYKREKIQFNPVVFYDSQPLLDILGLTKSGNAKLGIYQLLDDQTRSAGSDKKIPCIGSQRAFEKKRY
jgi:myosin heavy subunit